MDFHAYLEKLRGLSDKQKKIVLWTIVAVLAIIMGLFWIRGAMDSLSKISQEAGKIQLPQIETQNTDALNNLFSDQTPAETADWQTYTNNTLNYEFKYPKDFTKQEISKYQADDYVFRACDLKNNICLYSNIIRYKQPSFDDYVSLMKNQIVNQNNNPNLKALNNYDIEIDSKKSFVLATSVSSPDKEKKVIEVFIDYNWPILIQINISGDNVEIGDLQDNFDKIISTFKFIGPKSASR